MAVINVQNWNVEQVVDWISGLSPCLSQYAQNFALKGITGQRLLNLMQGDLEYHIGVTKIGDQLLLHDAIQTLRDELQTPWITLQSLASSLSVRCKNYRSELTMQNQKECDAIMKQQQTQQQNHHHHHHNHHDNNHTTRPSTSSSTPQQQQQQPNSRTNSSNNTSTTTTPSTNNNNTTQPNNGPSSSSSTNQPNSSNSTTTKFRLKRIPTCSLASAGYLLDAGKVLIRWLTRFPFLGKLDYDEISRKLSKHCFELAVLSQRDTFADNAIEEVQYLCTKMIELCEALINAKDSLIIQPAGIDIITLRKRTEQDWGLQFESSYWGLHQISGVKLSSPAHQSGHLERGDEILQVNYQTVLAWPQPSVITLLHENENEVIITVKRRPRHASTNLLLLGGHQNNMYLSKVPNRKSFFERNSSSRVGSSNVVVIHEVVNEEDSTNSRSASIHDVRLERRLGVGGEKSILKINKSIEDDDEDDEDEDDDDDESRNSNALCNNNNSSSGDEKEKSAVRFWKLYPKPKYLIKRRATVTGASPTDTRPPVTFIHDLPNTKTSSSTTPPSSSSPNNNNGSSSQHHHHSNNPHQQVHHRRSTPVTNNHNSESPPPTNTCLSPTIPGIVQGNYLNPPVTPRPPLDKSRSAPEEETNNVSVDQSDVGVVQQEATVSPSIDDEVFGAVVVDKAEESSNSPRGEVNKPKPKPRLSKSSVSSLKKQDHVVDSSDVVEVQSSPQQPELTERNDSKITEPPTRNSDGNKILHKGTIHIRSQLRKQSSSNSASALPVLGGYSNNSVPVLVTSSSSPRWIRQTGVFYSTRELEIVNNAGNAVMQQQKNNFRVKIADMSRVGGVVRGDEFSVLPASEVHSRPFAFKITSGDGVTYYLAAESQPELDNWISVMTGGEGARPCGASSTNTTITRVRNSSVSNLSSVGDTGRRNFCSSSRAAYKRSVSLGSSNQSPTVSNTNLANPSPPPPPATTTQYPRGHHSSSSQPLTSRFYSTTNLSKPYNTRSYTTPQDKTNIPPAFSRSKSSSLKTDWFLRSNISSITITSKKSTSTSSSPTRSCIPPPLTQSHTVVATQYPTPTGTPTKTSSSNQPMMGVSAMKTKKPVGNNSPTRKYMCPNCCNVMKVDTGTQTESTASTELGVSASPPPPPRGEVKLVFYDNGGESRV